MGGIVTVESSYRMRSKNSNTSGKIEAVLKSKEEKRSLVELTKKMKLSTTDVNQNWNKNGIYVKNHLLTYISNKEEFIL